MARIKSTNVLSFFKEQITLLESSNKLGTARNYRRTLSSFSLFLEGRDIPFRLLDEPLVIRYESWLRSRGVLRNSSSFYMRVLRSVYNKAVTKRLVKQTFPFQNVYTGVDIRQKKALPMSELRRLLYEDPKSESLRRTQSIAALMFQFCGMSFADLAHLEKSSLEQNVIRYNRVKTKTPISVEILDTAKDMINQLRNRQPPHPNCPDYLFNILSGDKKRKDESGYREYQSALRRFNNRLKGLAKALRLTSPVTSYTLRHSWATTAKYRGVSIEMISELLGHKSIKTTQIYLKGFELRERTEVNRMNLYYVRSAPNSRV